jgi:hypothetical protein
MLSLISPGYNISQLPGQRHTSTVIYLESEDVLSYKSYWNECVNSLAMKRIWNLEFRAFKQLNTVLQSRDLPPSLFRICHTRNKFIWPTFLITSFVSGLWNDPATLASVTFLSDLFSTVREIWFFSPFTTSVGGLGFSDRTTQLALGDIRPKGLFSGKDAETRISGSVAFPVGAVYKHKISSSGDFEHERANMLRPRTIKWLEKAHNQGKTGYASCTTKARYRPERTSDIK